MTHALQEKAMLVNLSISSWTASKKDKAASKAVKAAAGAQDRAGWYNKRLIDPRALESLGKIEGRARDYHYKLTLPWGDNGDRILPAAAYMQYVDGFRGYRAEYDAAVVSFVAAYPGLVQAARQMLGTMYDPADYPEVTKIRHRFDIRLVFTPVPDAKDFRVEVGDEAVAEIKKSISESVDNRMRGATKECWLRLDEVVGKMYRTLSDPDTVFRDTLVENIRVLVELLPKLNITNDQILDNCIVTTRSWLLVDIEALRKDKKFRQFIADKAAQILELIEPWVKTEAFQ